MDNLKYYNDSLAYDFEMFAPKPKRETVNKNNIVVMPKKKAKAKKKVITTPVLLVFTAMVVLAGLCGNISLRLKINEIDTQINEVRANIAELDSEKAELEVEMQRRISYANLEVEATKLGMKKPDKDDVIYIRINDKNAAKTADGSVVVSE